jgi:hypothetical protein
MIRQIGSQAREPLEDTEYEVYQGPNEDGEIILIDESEKKELWVQREDFAGYVVEIDGIGYEFVTSL